MSFSLSGDHAFDLDEINLEKPVFLDDTAPLRKAVELMRGGKHNASQSCVLIREQEKLVGIVTERD